MLGLELAYQRKPLSEDTVYGRLPSDIGRTPLRHEFNPDKPELNMA
jgi:hypothetical protein